MANIRYYDYGVMRRESERRMYDAQRRSGQDIPVKRIAQQNAYMAASGSGICDETAETRPAPANGSAESQDVSELKTACTVQRKGESGFSAEQLLIAALLLLTLSEGNKPLTLVLLWLLI